MKPAHEPVVVARKPLVGTLERNVLAFGTGALNIDGCRIGGPVETWPATRSYTSGNQLKNLGGTQYESARAQETGARPSGRWPANTILVHSGPDENGNGGCVRVGTRRVKGSAPQGQRGEWNRHGGETGPNGLSEHGIAERYTDADGTEQVDAWECDPQCPVRQLDEQSGTTSSRSGGVTTNALGQMNDDAWVAKRLPRTGHDDKGGASRFFATFQHSEPRFCYCAKSSTRERSAGLPEGERNIHPTCKPIGVMRWLIRLICPPGGTILDPFLGSGTTGCAAMLEPCVGRFVGIEQDSEYARIARVRIQHHANAETQLALDAA